MMACVAIIVVIVVRSLANFFKSSYILIGSTLFPCSALEEEGKREFSNVILVYVQPQKCAYFSAQSFLMKLRFGFMCARFFGLLITTRAFNNEELVEKCICTNNTHTSSVFQANEAGVTLARTLSLCIK